MAMQYGPWATSINACGNPQLSTFWRRRLTMLASASQTSPVLSWRSLVCLFAAGTLMMLLPTFRPAVAAAEEEKPAGIGKEIAPSSAPERSSGSREKKSSEQPGIRNQRKDPEKHSPATLAAQRAYEANVEAYRVGNADIEAVYRWSCRWMQADRADRGMAAAVTAHLDRMQAFCDQITKLHKNGSKGGEDANFEAARYYVLEAKQMLKTRKSPRKANNGESSGGGAMPPLRILPPKIDAKAAGDEAIKQFDADHDGKLSGKELDKCPGLKAAVDKIAPRHEITAEKIAARIKAWQDSKLGRMSLGCRVSHNGIPLAGAEVKFVPEKFLGKDAKAATGKTDSNGMAMIAMADDFPPGVAPGFYRVEITKAGEKIPAKYNTDTIFGQEVAIDAAGIREGIKFDLKY